MATTTFPDDVNVFGRLSASSMTLPDNSVTNQKVSAGDPLDCTKTIHQHMVRFASSGLTAPVAAKSTLHQGNAAGSLTSAFVTVSVAATSDATVSITIKKNGATVLSSTPFVVDSTLVVFTKLNIPLNSLLTGYVNGDTFTAEMTVAAGSGVLPLGLMVTLIFRELSGS